MARNIANSLDFLVRNTFISLDKNNKIFTEILTFSRFEVHPINWAKEEPRNMTEALYEGMVGYAVYNRTGSL